MYDGKMFHVRPDGKKPPTLFESGETGESRFKV